MNIKKIIIVVIGLVFVASLGWNGLGFFVNWRDNLVRSVIIQTRNDMVFELVATSKTSDNITVTYKDKDGKPQSLVLMVKR